MRVLVSYATKHGSTAELAVALAQNLAQLGPEAEALPAEAVAEIGEYDAAVIGSAVYMGHWLPPARKLVETQAKALAGMPVWLFSSGPLGPPEELKPEGDPVDVADLAERARPVEHRVFAGKLDKESLSFGERAMVRAVRAPEGDFRNWAAVEAFARDIARRLA